MLTSTSAMPHMPMPPMPTKWILVSCLRNMVLYRENAFYQRSLPLGSIGNDDRFRGLRGAARVVDPREHHSLADLRLHPAGDALAAAARRLPQRDDFSAAGRESPGERHG